MQSIIDAIEQWLKDFLIGAITGNLSNMFSDVNNKVATIATEVGKTPESWNSDVFSIILTLSRNVVVPISSCRNGKPRPNTCRTGWRLARPLTVCL